jgi:hypothetical protein
MLAVLNIYSWVCPKGAKEVQVGLLPDASRREVFCLPSPVLYLAAIICGGLPHTSALPFVALNTCIVAQGASDINPYFHSRPQQIISA